MTSLFDYGQGQARALSRIRISPRYRSLWQIFRQIVVAIAAQAVAASGVTDPGAAAATAFDYIAGGGKPSVIAADKDFFQGASTSPASVTESVGRQKGRRARRLRPCIRRPGVAVRRNRRQLRRLSHCPGDDATTSTMPSSIRATTISRRDIWRDLCRPDRSPLPPGKPQGRSRSRSRKARSGRARARTCDLNISSPGESASVCAYRRGGGHRCDRDRADRLRSGESRPRTRISRQRRNVHWQRRRLHVEPRRHSILVNHFPRCNSRSPTRNSAPGDSLTGSFTWQTVAGYENYRRRRRQVRRELTSPIGAGFERPGADGHDGPKQVRRAGRRHHLHARRHQRQRLFRAAFADHADDHRHARSSQRDLQPGLRRRAHRHLHRRHLQFPGGRRVHAGEIEPRRRLVRHSDPVAALHHVFIRHLHHSGGDIAGRRRHHVRHRRRIATDHGARQRRADDAQHERSDADARRRNDHRNFARHVQGGLEYRRDDDRHRGREPPDQRQPLSQHQRFGAQYSAAPSSACRRATICRRPPAISMANTPTNGASRRRARCSTTRAIKQPRPSRFPASRPTRSAWPIFPRACWRRRKRPLRRLASRIPTLAAAGRTRLSRHRQHRDPWTRAPTSISRSPTPGGRASRSARPRRPRSA